MLTGPMGYRKGKGPKKQPKKEEAEGNAGQPIPLTEFVIEFAWQDVPPEKFLAEDPSLKKPAATPPGAPATTVAPNPATSAAAAAPGTVPATVPGTTAPVSPGTAPPAGNRGAIPAAAPAATPPAPAGVPKAN